MSYFILGDPDLLQAIDAEAVKSVQMRKNRGVFQLLFFSASGFSSWATTSSSALPE